VKFVVLRVTFRRDLFPEDGDNPFCRSVATKLYGVMYNKHFDLKSWTHTFYE